MTPQENKLILQYQAAQKEFALNMISRGEFTKIICTCQYAWIQLGNDLSELDTLVPTEPVKNPQKVIPFDQIKIGMVAYVEPRFSGPFSGEGWERITAIENGQFKAGNQWFSTLDGSPTTEPWGYHVSKIKN